MFARTAVSQSEHDRMVGAVVQALRQNGKTGIRADLPGYEQPVKITWRRTGKGHIPDVTAEGILVEVETADSIGTEHTKDQWTLFATYAKEHDVSFVVVVPKGSEQAARDRLAELGLQAQVTGV